MEEDDFIWGGGGEMISFGGEGAQRKLWTDHVAARPVREGDVPPRSRVKRGSKTLFVPNTQYKYKATLRIYCAS